MRDVPDDDARSVLLSVLVAERSDDEALRWFIENGVSLAQLTALGVLTLCQLYLRRSDFEAVSRVLSQATSDQLAQAPYLYFLRGAMTFARLLPVPEQATALSGLPMDVRNARPIVGDPELSVALNNAINDLRQALPLASTLGLRHAPRIIESYIIWCELLHPTRKQGALVQLRHDMEDNALAMSRVQYAFAYLRDYRRLFALLRKANCGRLIGIGAGGISASISITFSYPWQYLKKVIAFEIGTYEDWCLSGLSDHAPLIAEFDAMDEG